MADRMIPFEPSHDFSPDDGPLDEEEAYDALNDETFGGDVLEGDWEEDHERFAQRKEDIKQNGHISQSAYDAARDAYYEEAGRTLEDSINRLVLDDNDEPHMLKRPPAKRTPAKPLQSSYSSDWIYNSSTPNSSVWSVFPNGPSIEQSVPQVPKVEPPGFPPMLHVRNMKTLEEVERDLLSRSSIQQMPPHLLHNRGNATDMLPIRPNVFRIEDVERKLKDAPPPHMLKGHQPPFGMPSIIPLPPRTQQGGFPQMALHPQLLPSQLPRHLNPLPVGFVGQQQRHFYDKSFPSSHSSPQGIITNNNVYYQRRHLPNQKSTGSFAKQETNQDEYAGLMSARERQWLVNIQLVQLHSEKPFVDDYYYMMYKAKRPDERRQAGRGDVKGVLPPDKIKTESRTYTPVQFENSLGKLQVVSVMAPRKIMELSVASNDSKENLTASQKERRKLKQFLLEIEKLYIVLLELEDIHFQQEMHKVENVPECQELASRQQEYHRIINSVAVHDEKLLSYMLIRKGKNLVVRILPILDAAHCQTVLSLVLANFAVLSKRDQTDQALPKMYVHFRKAVQQSDFTTLLQFAKYATIVGNTGSSRGDLMKNNMVALLGNKLGISLILLLFQQANRLFPTVMDETIKSEWSTTVAAIVDASSSLKHVAVPLESFPGAIGHLSTDLAIAPEKYGTIQQTLDEVGSGDGRHNRC